MATHGGPSGGPSGAPPATPPGGPRMAGMRVPPPAAAPTAGPAGHGTPGHGPTAGGHPAPGAPTAAPAPTPPPATLSPARAALNRAGHAVNTGVNVGGAVAGTAWRHKKSALVIGGLLLAIGGAAANCVGRTVHGDGSSDILKKIHPQEGRPNTPSHSDHSEHVHMPTQVNIQLDANGEPHVVSPRGAKIVPGSYDFGTQRMTVEIQGKQYTVKVGVNNL